MIYILMLAFAHLETCSIFNVFFAFVFKKKDLLFFSLFLVWIQTLLLKYTFFFHGVLCTDLSFRNDNLELW